MPITMVQSGGTVTIARITGSDAIRQHLSELGFVVGDQVTVVSNNSGNLIVQVKDARIALDAKMANRIIVS